MKVIHFVIFIVGIFLVAQTFLTACPTPYYEELTREKREVEESFQSESSAS
ncbi:MAG: hypothetical protein ACJAZS_000038 [Alteromonas naphthalenivorans]|jgi:hypothetical protein